jgi:hypothetical protein
LCRKSCTGVFCLGYFQKISLNDANEYLYNNKIDKN